ncbi:hypothetical protein BDZ88DRAFT_194973 [Geranomyces variabilis]|nr:hypothetical protein BDZ88DRAFT_194973 [Geranomyces variabilis]
MLLQPPAFRLALGVLLARLCLASALAPLASNPRLSRTTSLAATSVLSDSSLASTCLNYGIVNHNGQCLCPAGFGGVDCGTPQCDSLATGPDRRLREPNEPSCGCLDGWTGINCNVCMRDDVCAPLRPPRPGDVLGETDNPICHSSVRPINGTNYLQCEVTNTAIVKQLEGKKPEITYTCDAAEATCQFQFWADEEESFFCRLSECSTTQEYEGKVNRTEIQCAKMKCSCYPGRMLCDPHGFDLTDWFESDDPEEGGPRGPGALQCEESAVHDGELPERTCAFSEKWMNKLINDVFGDPNIQLSCPLAGECMYASQLPAAGKPKYRGFSVLAIVFMALFAALLVFSILGAIYWARTQNNPDLNGIYESMEDGDDEPLLDGEQSNARRANMMDHHVASDIMFRDITYTIDLPKKPSRHLPFQRRNNAADEGGSSVPNPAVLRDVQGIVKAGEVMAVMGGSGAGKTTFLDILAKREKRGAVTGDILVNGKFMSDAEYRSIVGYVDQEDTLMPTLTVYETVLYSALLRLPRSMSTKEKEERVMETLIELDILHIANRRIGTTGERGISGGEKRRVSIACELVTGPSILFLDEPTSGLDAFNAYNVIESLVNLARTYRRTVILTIHQPRSNIFALFDKLVLLAKGRVVYSGPAQQDCRDCFEQQGFKCPLGFNMADYLIDLTMHVVNTIDPSPVTTSSPESEAASPRKLKRKLSIRAAQEAELYTQHKAATEGASSPATNGAGGASSAAKDEAPTTPVEELKPLLPLPDEGGASNGGGSTFLHIPGSISASQELEEAVTQACRITSINGRPSGASLSSQMSRLLAQSATFSPSHHTGASAFTQFAILSQRTIKNLYRNPYLLLTHYLISILVAISLGLLYWHLDLTISGFQNRMGVLFFVCAVFGFGCLSSMMVFGGERVVFVRERAGGYYSAGIYFLAKVLFDLIPLRTIPPLLLGLISYHMMGLRSDDFSFLLKFLLVLVLFNLAAASACLTISIAIPDTAVATLVATLLMLFEMLFGGMLLNKNWLGKVGKWACDWSFFNAGWEALMVNEVNGLILVDRKFLQDINVPGAAILGTFGLNALGYWNDVGRLIGMIVVLLAAGMAWLILFVKEKR